MTTTDAARDRVRTTWQQYESGTDRAGDDRPLAGYAVLLSVYGAACAALAAAARRRHGRGEVPTPPGPLDLLLTAVAVFRLTRTLAKDAVLSPVRAPFTTYLGPGQDGEVLEAPRPGHLRHAVGELLTCPFCLSQWVSTAAVGGHLLAPRTTRWVVRGMAVVAASDALQLGYDAAARRVG